MAVIRKRVLRARRQRGWHLPPIDAAAVVAGLPDAAALHQDMVASGYTLRSRTRPYQCIDGEVSVQLVWTRGTRTEGSTRMRRWTVAPLVFLALIPAASP